ncbi:PadR family transcriptional regulator [uncultured Jatrophihabitans sp.]|uniref:PadR family transcriptional regulator n=1 Tax=uncultured Jatrophihabitans sp. TaxID=1610747 RepID=UPI0035CA739B
MTTPRSTTAYAILGLLGVRSWTTYELAKQVQRSLNWFWPRAERKLYDEPKRLVADGLATASVEATGKRSKTVYGITEAGRAELRRWLDEPSAPRSGEFEAMMKVFFADAGSVGQLRTTLGRIREEAAERIDRLGEMTAAVAAEPRFPERLHISALSVRLQLEQELGILRWADWADEQVAQWPAADDAGAWDVQGSLAATVADSEAATGH